MKALFVEMRKTMSKKEYKTFCNSHRATNGFNTGTRTFSDKRFGKQGANTRWADAEY